MQFSKKPIMSNFGDLPRGEIPEPLKFNRPFRKFFCLFSLSLYVYFFIIILESTTLSNGIRVCTE